jgi:hypothetical protein
LGTIATFSRSKIEKRETALMDPTMPIGRYFLFAGSALLSLLYLADWYVPRLAAEPAHSEVDRTIIRIRSEHQWPIAVAIDTNVKPINPPIRGDFPSSPVDPERFQDKSKNEAFAYASALLPQALPNSKRLARPALRPMRGELKTQPRPCCKTNGERALQPE